MNFGLKKTSIHENLAQHLNKNHPSKQTDYVFINVVENSIYTDKSKNQSLAWIPGTISGMAERMLQKNNINRLPSKYISEYPLGG